MRRCLILIGLTVLLACAGTPAGIEMPIRTGDVLRVLFIGNSLTYTNTLPAIVEALADSAKVKPLAWKMVAYPDYNLEDHWNRLDALQAIGEAWEIVVLQQGPSSTAANRAHLIYWTQRFNEEIRKSGGRPGLFAVWPQEANLSTLEASAESYRLAADSVSGLLFPVSRAWQAMGQRRPSAQLYSDGLHPNVAGSYLAALVIFQRLYERSPVGLPTSLRLRLRGSPLVIVDPALGSDMQLAAEAAQTTGNQRRSGR